MSIPEEISQETGLTEAQVSKLSEHISSLETSWGAKANQNAEKIIEGAAKKVEEVTGIQREKGQKLADYIMLASETHLKDKITAISAKEKDLAEKIKNAGHNETIVAELTATKEQLDKLKAKEAVFAEWEQNDYKGKYQSLSNEYETMKVDLAFGKVKPVFPETVNKYEADFKWEQFKKSVLDKNTIRIVDGETILVDKENEYKTSKLAELVEKDENLKALLKGQQNNGFGSKPAKTVKVEGVPFDVPLNADSKQRTLLIREYLTSNGITMQSKEYPAKFAELNAKILSQRTV